MHIAATKLACRQNWASDVSLKISCSSSTAADMICPQSNVADPQSVPLKIHAVQGRGRVQIVPSTSQRLFYGREGKRGEGSG